MNDLFFVVLSRVNQINLDMQTSPAAILLMSSSCKRWIGRGSDIDTPNTDKLVLNGYSNSFS